MEQQRVPASECQTFHNLKGFTPACLSWDPDAILFQ